jgi:hypothetical protein
LFAATPVGVHRSNDAGRTWILPGTGPTVPLASAVTPSPRFALDKTLFACGVDGLYRSTTAGETWQRVLAGGPLLSVVVSATDEALVVLAGTESDGILRSEDGGRTWTGANAGLLDLTAICLAVSPCFVSDRTGFAGTASGLYRTRNGARSWRVIETGRDDPAVQCLLVSPSFPDDRLILAGTEADGLLRSVDGGTSWHSPPTLNEGGVTALAYGSGTFAAATQGGMALSQDGGETWRMVETAPGEPALSVAFEGEALLVGLHRRGVFRSDDAGATWRPANQGLSARLDTELVLSPEFAQNGTLFVGGLDEGVRVSTDAGVTWQDRNAGLEDAAVYNLAASAANSLFAATGSGVHVSRDCALTWGYSTTDAGPVRIVATGASVIVAAVASGHLVVSQDDGSTWRDLGVPFEGAEVVALAVAPNRTLFAATATSADVTLWRSEDGQRWARWLVEPARGAARVTLAVAPTHTVDDAVFLGLGHRVLRPLRHAQEVRHTERRPIWRSADLGSDVVNITSLAVSPGARSVFAATNAGVFVSRDGGESFVDWNEGLLNPRLVAIAASPNYAEDRLVYALSLGGTIWRRTDR